MSNYQITFNGVTIGAGTNYVIENIDGLGGTAPLRVQDDNRGYIDGSYTGRDFYDERIVTIDMLILGDGSHTAQYYYKQLQSAFYPQQIGYYVDPTGGTPSANQLKLFQFQLNSDTGLKRMYGRFRGFTTAVDPEFTYGYITSQWIFFCPDPRAYDNSLLSTSMSADGPLGRTYNRTYNLTYLSGTYAPNTPVFNAGQTTTYPVITLNGPATNPVFGNETTGNYLTLNYAFTNTDVCVIDLGTKTITLNGNPARNLMQGGSTWFYAQPGNNAFYFNASAILAGTTSVSVSWRNAYI